MRPRTKDTPNRLFFHANFALEVLESRTLLSVAPMAFVGPRVGSSVRIEVPDLPISEPMLAVPAQSWSNLIRLDEFRGDSRFNGVDGSGFTTVVIDGGADLNHPFFGPDGDSDGVADAILYQYDFADDDSDATAASDHGPNVASIIVSRSGTYPGVAPGATLIVLKVFTDAGTGNFAMVENALRWTINNLDNYNISSVNISLGDSQNHAAHAQRYGIGDELEILAGQDVKVVASAGNSFYTFNSLPGAAYPASDPNVIGVGAVFATQGGTFRAESGATAYSTSPDQIAPFSQRASFLTSVFAPGVGITGANRNGGTVTMSGTSQAAPIVAGLAALADGLAFSLMGRRLTLAEFRSVLTTTASPIEDGDDEDDNVDNTSLRFGRVDAVAMGEAIVAMADVAAPNRAPAMTSVVPLARAIPGRPLAITYERLVNSSNAGDADGDALRFRIESVLSGSLLKDGVAVVPGVTTIGAGERLVWKPSAVTLGRTDAFTVVAFDGVLASAGGVVVGVVSGPTVLGITSRIDRESRGQPAPTQNTQSGPFVRGIVRGAGLSDSGDALPGGWVAPSIGWDSVVGRKRSAA